MAKCDEIMETLNTHHVTRLCHMTQIDKLFSILCGDSGIWASDFYEGTAMYHNDCERRDGKTEYISTSIEYPNVWYYKAKRYVNPHVNTWAVIFIDPIVCENEKTLYCPINSAASGGRYISDDVSGLKTAFDISVGRRKRTENMLDCCPTDDQAEVMVYRHISTTAIKGVVFESEAIARVLQSLFEKYHVGYPDLYASSDMFSTELSRMVRNGYKPCEKKIISGKQQNGGWVAYFRKSFLM